MSKSIYKYSVAIDGTDHYIDLPPESAVVHVDVQTAPYAQVTFWAEVSLPADTDVTRVFRVFGTGYEIPDDYEYVGTTLGDRPLVWHLFERKS